MSFQNPLIPVGALLADPPEIDSKHPAPLHRDLFFTAAFNEYPGFELPEKFVPVSAP